ncbi:ArpU family phage packaging/lysis transcriptional regulator [Ligilactobacillus equi]|uniref:Phage transcriptional regulator, ArpU family n=1 Tax=Ligilactobacillus equi DSM 15833 = JCM 10991 TaxID=1423740 RepID=A0A0R1TFX6_9LACO|nr:ArpU family phage packaging/lysis transcriptional regulator [Ligilactobacillus equi]KRL79518.1 hypothetical protein FC36_GL000466 [Ligilactobacillus equi DSM 15833 = JCM 10991]
MIFDEVDQKKTADKVDTFFKKDYERLKVMASVSIGSSSYGERVSESKLNGQEERYTRKAWASQIVEAVQTAINSCDERCKNLLELRYLKNYAVWQVAQNIGYSDSMYHQLRRKACNQFADAFEVVAEPLLGDDSDLHVYK